MLYAKDGAPKVRGAIGSWDVDERTGLWLPRMRKPNQIQISWGFIAAMQLGFRRQSRLDYSLSGLYIEYENVASPEDAVDVPTDFDRSENLDYYNGLLDSGTRDFLRVRLLQEPLLGIASDYEAYFEEGQGNQLTFMAMSAGLEGATGKEFSADANSKVCGVALIAMPVVGDRTQDVIFARTYFPEEDQVVKESSKQVGITWDVVFE